MRITLVGTRVRAPLGSLSATRQKVTKERAKGTPLGTPPSWIGICALPPQGAAAPLDPRRYYDSNLYLNSYGSFSISDIGDRAVAVPTALHIL